jgi:hypothetical protein
MMAEVDERLSHSHPVSTGWFRVTHYHLTVSTVYLQSENRKPLKRFDNQGALIHPVETG